MKSKTKIISHSPSPNLLAPPSFKRQARFLEAVKNAVPLKHAAILADIPCESIRAWRKQDAEGRAPQPIKKFVRTLNEARASAVEYLVNKVQRASSKDLNALTWLLSIILEEDLKPDVSKSKRSSITTPALIDDSDFVSSDEFFAANVRACRLLLQS